MKSDSAPGRRVNVACGDSFVEGWINLDYRPKSPAVRRANLLERLPLRDGCADVLYSSHFLEHIPTRRIRPFLEECRRVLRPGGYLRLATPDLEEMCREYLARRAEGEHDKADFVILELLDQCVRMAPGGQLLACYEELRGRSADAHMRDYVTIRTGEDLTITGAQTRSDRGRQLANATRRFDEVYSALERLYFRLLTTLLPRVYRDQNVSLARAGERHMWLYDFHSIRRLLDEAGFSEVTRHRSDSTGIAGFPLFPLDLNAEGKPRKGAESMYVEARRPSA